MHTWNSKGLYKFPDLLYQEVILGMKALGRICKSESNEKFKI